uniref:Uncharacterized protein n=1 Tax=Rhizophora mucronata TaxID=61149 RepID=A0A2P2NUD7_RHIMU
MKLMDRLNNNLTSQKPSLISKLFYL